MDLSPDFVLALIVAVTAGCIGLAVHAWAIIRHLDGKRERGDEVLHKRINEVRDEYVQKAQYEADRQRIEREFSRIESTVTSGFAQMNERLDRIFGLFTNGSKGG